MTLSLQVQAPLTMALHSISQTTAQISQNFLLQEVKALNQNCHHMMEVLKEEKAPTELMFQEPSLVTNIQVETTVKEMTERVTEKSQENRS